MKSELILILQLKLKSIFSKIFKRAIGKYAMAIIAKTENGLFAVDPEDFDVGRSLLKNGSWECEQNNWLKNYLNPESSVLIIGAHIGALAIPLSKYCKTVIAIEANPNTFSLLELNIALNNAFNCKAFCVAANDKKEQLKFLHCSTNSGGSKRVPRHDKYIYYYDNPETILVDAVKLDDYLQIDKFDLIIMDIEGSEYFALKGMQNILRKSKAIQIEFLPHHFKDVSGITVEQFIDLIEPHFTCLTIPSLNLKIDKAKFKSVLNDMFNKNLEDDGIIFQKAEIGQPVPLHHLSITHKS